MKVLGVVHDPGGASALSPVMRKLCAHETTTLLAGAFATEKLGDLSPEPIPSSVDASFCFEFFEKAHPQALISGTSWNSNVEQMFRNHAASQGIPSVTMIDYWANYAPRWQGASYSIGGLADTVCVIDEAMRLELVAEGFPESKIEVTGHPMLEQISLRPRPPAVSDQYLFLSEPNRDGTLPSVENHPLKLIASAIPAGSTLWFKKHPKEKLPENIEEFLSASCGGRVEVKLFTHQPDLSQFTCIFGFRTMGLFESRCAGIPAVSIHTNSLSGALGAAMKSHGIIRPSILNLDGLKAAISAAQAAIAPGSIHLGATDKVLSILRSVTA